MHLSIQAPVIWIGFGPGPDLGFTILGIIRIKLYPMPLFLAIARTPAFFQKTSLLPFPDPPVRLKHSPTVHTLLLDDFHGKDTFLVFKGIRGILLLKSELLTIHNLNKREKAPKREKLRLRLDFYRWGILNCRFTGDS